MRAPSVPQNLKATATRVYKESDFAVGDKVFHRSWTLQATRHDVSYPVIDRRFKVVTEIRTTGSRVNIYCGRFSFSAFELIKES